MTTPDLLTPVDLLQRLWEPMLLQSAKTPPTGDGYLSEIKWDGIRGLISLDKGELRIRSRNQHDLTLAFPELQKPEESFRATDAVFDGEIVCLDEEGRPILADVLRRIQLSSEHAVERARKRHPAVCYLFDCLFLNGRQITQEPLERRRAWLKDVILPGSPYRMSESVSDGPALFAAAKRMGLEGIVAKERGSLYYPGRRSSVWQKIKVHQTTVCTIIGYTPGGGSRSSTFGSLYLAKHTGQEFQYVGKVGTGFDNQHLQSIGEALRALDRVNPPDCVNPPVGAKCHKNARIVWVEPKLVCEIQHASWTKHRRLREPVFVRLRPELNHP